MNGSDLKYLAAVSDLARLDLEAAAVGLIFDGEMMTSRYRGAYSSGERELHIEESGQRKIPEFAVEINAARFKALAALFDDQADVLLRLRDNTLNISSTGSSGRGLALVTQRNEVEQLPDLDTADASLSVVIDAGVLAQEIELAAEFNAKNMANPLLTGVNVHVSAKQAKVTVMTYDGVAALFRSSVPITPSKRSKVYQAEWTVPSLDFLLGLKTIGGGEAKLEAVERDGQIARCRVIGAGARFSCGLLDGEWPDVSPVTGRKDFVRTFDIPATALRTAVASARALNPNYATSGVVIQSDDKQRINVQTADSEAGNFTIRAGKLEDGGDLSYRYSVTGMALASKLGDVITIDVPEDSKLQTRVTSGSRRCWINAMAQDV